MSTAAQTPGANGQTPFILCISTSSGVAHVAAICQQGMLFGYTIEDYKAQSAQLLPQLQEGLLPLQGKAYCVAIACDIGPGGFTSLRTACGVTQGLALAWGVPVVALSSFELMIASACAASSLPLGAPAACLIDARLGEYYSARLALGSGATQWFTKPHLRAAQAGLAGLEGPVLCPPGLIGELTADAAGPVCIAVEHNMDSMGSLAWREFNAQRLQAPIGAQPLYVRDKVAQTTLERQGL